MNPSGAITTIFRCHASGSPSGATAITNFSAVNSDSSTPRINRRSLLIFIRERNVTVNGGSQAESSGRRCET